MIKCLIVEDEPLAQQILQDYIADHPDLELEAICGNPVEAMKELSTHAVDLIFLDVNLPKLSGVQWYKTLKRPPQVIITTASPDHAIEGFELEATDYLLKPFGFDRFMMAVEKVKTRLLNQATGATYQDPVLVIKVDKKLYRVPYSEISYIESIGDYVKVHTNEKTYLSTDTLKSLEQTLPVTQFQRVHKSYIVALQRIDYLEGNRLMVKQEMIPVGQSYRAVIQQLFKG